MTDNTNTAATSGDAPDLQQLKALALAATPGPWVAGEPIPGAPRFLVADCGPVGKVYPADQKPSHGTTSMDDAKFIAAASPAVVLGLIARIESAAAPAPQFRKLTSELSLNELAREFFAVSALGGDVTLSSGACLKLYEAMTTPPAAAPATASGDELPPLPEPVSAATKPTADLGGLQRYGEVAEADGSGEYVTKAADGEFVKFCDVQSLLATKPAAAPVVPEGFLVVPKVPTRSMIAKTIDAVFDGAIEDASVIEEVYAAMIAATPAASTTGAAQTAEQVRNQALEQAAKVCDGVHKEYVHHARRRGETDEEFYDAYMNKSLASSECAAAIRALKRPTPTHSSEAGE
jgi:hypothetical protein